ncbi:hypothetical protein L0337_43000 [candidate division KSB1 bacterium]|nr:hypothetical protein [candidate division KSB1 bacterium]
MLLLGLLTLATLNPPAFFLTQNRPAKFERIGWTREFGKMQSFEFYKTKRDLCDLARRMG